ncbi:MAG: hypothetical protein ACH6QJ_00360 [Candidatus Carsonella ruddii]
MINFFFFKIGKKNYLGKLNNFLIIDYINKNVGTKLVLKKIILTINKKILINNNINLKIYLSIVKHFYIKTFSIKKRRRKNFINKNISYKKKSLIFFEKNI